MPKPRPWTVHPHDPLEQLEDNLWAVDGDTPRNPIRRRMAIVRLSTGQLVIHSGIACDDETMANIEALGEPAYLIVPNAFHTIDAVPYKRRYPEIALVCHAGSRAKLEKKSIPVDGTYESLPDDPALRAVPLDGCPKEGAFSVTSEGGRMTLLVNDVIFNIGELPGFSGLILRIMGSAGGPKVTWLGKRLAVDDRGALAAQLERLADTPNLVRILMAHGAPITENIPAALRHVIASLA